MLKYSRLWFIRRIVYDHLLSHTTTKTCAPYNLMIPEGKLLKASALHCGMKNQQFKFGLNCDTKIKQEGLVKTNACFNILLSRTCDINYHMILCYAK
jgi:hypothetical protein